VVDDGALDVLDGDWLGVDAEDTRALAGSGAHTAGELGEAVGLQQLEQGLLPVSLEDEVVPLGDDVAQRAAVLGLAEGYAAVHATCRLFLQALFDFLVVEDLAPVGETLYYASVLLVAALVFVEAAELVECLFAAVVILLYRVFDIDDSDGFLAFWGWLGS